MKEQFRYSSKIVIISVVAFLLGYKVIGNKRNSANNEKLPVRISFSSLDERNRLKDFGLKFTGEKEDTYMEARVSWQEFMYLKQQGFDPALIVEIEGKKKLDPQYHTLAEIKTLLYSFAEKYPHIVNLSKIGTSTQYGLPIWAVKISDNPDKEEEEPSMLFTGVHHAREPLGAEICLYLIEYLCEHYQKKESVTRWVNEIEIWFVPVVNPDGYSLVMDNGFGFPYWRKNLRDNNGNGRFDPEVDGVDLNRNYNFNWAVGSDGNPRSWFYRGPYPFSERETQALRELTLREQFVFGIGYHSYGESILYPWGNFRRPPDEDLIIELARQMASRIKKQSGWGHYSILPLNARVGQSSNWMYGRAGVLDFIVETGEEYFPPGKVIKKIAKENAKAAFFLMDRLFGAGITGYVLDGDTRKPLRARVVVEELYSPHVSATISDYRYGRYFRILQPGTYTLKFSCEGYWEQVCENVKVKEGQTTYLDVNLYRKDSRVPAGNGH